MIFIPNYLWNHTKLKFSMIPVAIWYEYHTSVFAMNRSASVTEMLHQLQWDTLEATRNNLCVILLYKIINKLVDTFSEEQLLLTNSVTRGHPLRYLQPPTKIDAYKYSFFPSAIRIWNSLPSDIV